MDEHMEEHEDVEDWHSHMEERMDEDECHEDVE